MQSRGGRVTYSEYRLISKIGEGTFSEVLKAQSIKTSKYVAIKCMKNHFDSIEQVRRNSLTPPLGHESARNPGLEAPVSTRAYHPSARSAVVSLSD